MISPIASIMVLGRPLFAYFGLLAFLLFIAAAIIGRLTLKGKAYIPFRWHPRLALSALVVALIHAILALSIFFHF
jgi:hypothetical protein